MKIQMCVYPRLLFILVIQLYFRIGGAQSLERFSIDFLGGLAVNDNHQVHFSFGESFIKTQNVGKVTISEGFIQGEIKEIPTPVQENYPNLKMSISPNPNFGHIEIVASQAVPQSRIILFNTEGNPLIQKPFLQSLQMDLSQVSSGTYFIIWTNQQGEILKNFKFVKL
ncbi:MAG: T9SS type A sorting domain-containing protein [Saprospiraceae bacterium]|nr:T9SS type A sorting domain-containing protein [Saprospiraceae bacterium]